MKYDHRKAMIERFGSEEAWMEKKREWGRKGGKKSPTNFKNLDPEKRKEIARRGHRKMIKNQLEKYPLIYEELDAD